MYSGIISASDNIWQLGLLLWLTKSLILPENLTAQIVYSACLHRAVVVSVLFSVTAVVAVVVVCCYDLNQKPLVFTVVFRTQLFLPERLMKLQKITMYAFSMMALSMKGSRPIGLCIT